MQDASLTPEGWQRLGRELFDSRCAGNAGASATQRAHSVDAGASAAQRAHRLWRDDRRQTAAPDVAVDDAGEALVLNAFAAQQRMHAARGDGAGGAAAAAWIERCIARPRAATGTPQPRRVAAPAASRNPVTRRLLELPVARLYSVPVFLDLGAFNYLLRLQDVAEAKHAAQRGPNADAEGPVAADAEVRVVATEVRVTANAEARGASGGPPSPEPETPTAPAESPGAPAPPTAGLSRAYSSISSCSSSSSGSSDDEGFFDVPRLWRAPENVALVGAAPAAVEAPCVWQDSVLEAAVVAGDADEHAASDFDEVSSIFSNFHDDGDDGDDIARPGGDYSAAEPALSYAIEAVLEAALDSLAHGARTRAGSIDRPRLLARPAAAPPPAPPLVPASGTGVPRHATAAWLPLQPRGTFDASPPKAARPPGAEAPLASAPRRRPTARNAAAFLAPQPPARSPPPVRPLQPPASLQAPARRRTVAWR